MSSDFLLEDLNKDWDGPVMDYGYCEFTGTDPNTITLSDYKASSRGTEATVTINGIRANKGVLFLGQISKSDLTDLLRQHIFGTIVYPNNTSVHGIALEEGVKDNIDESLLEDAQPAESLDVVELLRKRGYNEGAVVIIGKGYDILGDTRYGIIADIWQDHKTENTIMLRMTDSTIAEAVDCQIANDVNKHILRMIEAEKGRIMEQAIKFCEKIDSKIDAIIYE